MAHALILGMTLSGKTHLAKALCNKAKTEGVGTIVLDPFRSGGWNASFITDDPKEFLRVCQQSRNCACFIDEAAENAGRFDKEMLWTATRGRHFGHRYYYISQRGALLELTTRDQCSTAYVFRVGSKDAKILAEEFSDDNLLKASSLAKFHFIHCDRFTPGKVCVLKA